MEKVEEEKTSEGEDAAEEFSSSMNSPKNLELDRRIYSRQKAVLETLEYIKRNVETGEHMSGPDSILVMRAKESLIELEREIEALYTAICEKEEEDDE